MSTPQLALKHRAKKYIDLKYLFPRCKPDLRKKLNKSQVAKINKALDAIEKNYGGFNQIVPINKGRTKYMDKTGTPRWVKGIPLPGGEKQNIDLNYVDGELKYKRGKKHLAERAIIEIDTAHGEEGVKISVKKILKKKKGRKVLATANNRVIGEFLPRMSDAIFTKRVLYNFNKYENAFMANGLVDEDTENIPHGLFVVDNTVYRYIGGNKNKPVPVARPMDWGMGIMFEGKTK